MEKWKNYAFYFLLNSSLKDFRINLKACKLKKWEIKQLIGKMKNNVGVLT
jgi:hypothetical protein